MTYFYLFFYFYFQVTWFKDSGKIFETDRALMTVKGATWALKLSQLQPSDFGNYRYLFHYFAITTLSLKISVSKLKNLTTTLTSWQLYCSNQLHCWDKMSTVELVDKAATYMTIPIVENMTFLFMITTMTVRNVQKTYFR